MLKLTICNHFTPANSTVNNFFYKVPSLIVLSKSPPILASVDLKLGAENKINLNLKPPYLLIFKLESTDNKLVLSELSGKIEIQYLSDNSYSIGEYLQYNEEKKYFEYAITSVESSYFILKFPFHLPTPKTTININPNGVSEYEFTLVKGLGFEGIISNANGQKIVDTHVEIEPLQKVNNYYHWSSTDEYRNVVSSSSSYYFIQNQNGKFVSYGYTSGKYQLKVSHYDYIPHIEELELSNKSILDMQIILKKGSQISGNVSSANGSLVSNAKIDLVLQDDSLKNNNNGNFHAGTDINGYFIFKNIPMGKYKMFITCLSGYLENYEIVVNESQDITNLNITLEDSLEISGVVVDEKGKPLNKIWISLKQVENNQSDIYGQHSDSSGVFKFTRVVNKMYLFHIHSLEGYMLETEVTAMGGDKNVRLVLKSPRRALISGHVYLPDGKECANYSIAYIDMNNKQLCDFLEPKISGAGFQGSINIGNLQMIKVIAKSTGFGAGESAPFNLQQYSGQPILITLKNRIDLELRVIDSNTSEPIKHAKASLVSASQADLGHIYSEKLSDEKGHLVLDANAAGKMNLVVRAAGYVDNFIEIEILEKNAPTEVLMGKGGTIKGQVLDFENKFIPFISVSVLLIQESNNDYLQQNWNSFKATSDEYGYFEIKLVPPGKYYLITDGASKFQPKGLFRGLPLTVVEGKDINITLDDIYALNKFAKVNITLLGSNINKKEIRLSYSKALNKYKSTENIILTSNEDGKVSFLSVPMGEFNITVKGVSKPITMPLTITTDQEIMLEIPVD